MSNILWNKSGLQVFSRHRTVFLLLILAAEMPQPLDSSSALEFHGDSYVELKLSNNVAKTFSYDIWFLPTKSDGKKFYSFVSNRNITTKSFSLYCSGCFFIDILANFKYIAYSMHERFSTLFSKLNLIFMGSSLDFLQICNNFDTAWPVSSWLSIILIYLK